MKKLLIWILLAGMSLNLLACSAESVAPTTMQESAPVAETTSPQKEEHPETTAASDLEENLFLKVSSITFSLVGEQEDIYLGLAPREQVSWESEDPSIVSVEDGVLTANGVGTTTIYGTYGDQQVSCTAGCLAQTQEELDGLDDAILSAPKRLPPEVNLEESCTYFDNAAILGDSITYFLWQEENKNHYLGNMTFVARQGISVNSLVRRFKNLFYRGKELYIEDLIAQCEAERVYIMLGCLDFQVPAASKQLIDNWNIMLDRIEEKCPEKQIVIISNIPSSQEKTYPTDVNETVAKTNIALRQIAEDRGMGFLDLGYYIVDHQGKMPMVYAKDDYHMNADGCLAWTKILRYYAWYESEGGVLR